ncbi:MAG: hypothetical protein LQ348_005291 [Seirophora lacunosa]|nr:MAG: hypothetical protein LQ348_005291 [Seirophora lacunosa]
MDSTTALPTGARDSSPVPPVPSVQDLDGYRQTSRAGQNSKTELQPGSWGNSMADLPYHGPPTPDIVSSTTHLVPGGEAQTESAVLVSPPLNENSAK